MRTEPLVLAAMLLAACSGGVERYDGPVRNVVVITLDTLRADHLGCYGRSPSLTPVLDRLAAEAVRFDDVTTAAPTTLAAHVSLMTGTYPHTHGTPRNGFEVLPENLMLAELLRERGFATAAFLGSWALDASFGFDQGFDHFDSDFDIAAELRPAADGRGVEVRVEQDQRRAESVNRAVFRHLDASEAERRFLFLHYFDAHAPYDAPPPFGREEDGAPVGSTLEDLKRAVHAHQARFLDEPLGFDATIDFGLPRELIDQADGAELPLDRVLKDDYAREVRYLDDRLGALFEGLRARGILDDALVIVTADHGESFHEHGDYWNHGSWVYQTTARVPLIVWRAPGLRGAGEAGRTVAQPVSVVDVLPTVLALLDLPAPEAVEGVSLVPALAGEPFERGPVFCEATQPTHPDLEQPGWTNARKPRCVRVGPWKLIHAPLHGRLELYDLAGDPGEREDKSLDRSLDERRRALREALHAFSRAARPTRSTFNREQSEELVRRLKALGY